MYVCIEQNALYIQDYYKYLTVCILHALSIP